MKKIVFVLAVVGLVSCNSGNNASAKINEQNLEQAQKEAQQASKFPVISFEEKEHDFGKIKKNNQVETVFKFTNTGEAPLLIVDVSSSCGCTVPEKPKEPIAPGESGEIKVYYNGSGQEAITKTVTVLSNAKDQRTILTIKAFVEE